jgi:hypothetical protein
MKETRNEKNNKINVAKTNTSNSHHYLHLAVDKNAFH